MERSCDRLRVSLSEMHLLNAVIQDFENNVYPCLCGLVKWLFDGHSMTPIGPWDWSALRNTYTHTVTTELYKLISQWPHNEPALFRPKSILRRDEFKWTVTKSDVLIIPISVARVYKVLCATRYESRQLCPKRNTESRSVNCEQLVEGF
jgi:hypothetical protein